tara:strand:+ start:3618 stop:4013 length:396 start_codon:yes stop_codon:yes gene_type:complete
MKFCAALSILLFSLSAYSNSYVIVQCNGWGNQNTFELSGELDESGGNFLDGLINLKVYETGVLVFEKRRIDSTGFFWFDDIDNTQVYLAELIPTDRSTFQFLSIAGNHPRHSGNSYLRFNDIEYLAECNIH